MFHSQRVTVLESGPRIAPDVLEALGIFDDSICWGVWLPDSPDNRQIPHLLISPFHPDSWPCLLRLELRLSEKPGSLAEAAGVLNEAGANIVHARSMSTGHHHATWNVILESWHLRHRMGELRGSLGNDTTDSPEHHALIDIGVMLEARRIEQKMYEKDWVLRLERSDASKDSLSYFLRERFLPDREINRRRNSGKRREIFSNTLVEKRLRERVSHIIHNMDDNRCRDIVTTYFKNDQVPDEFLATEGTVSEKLLAMQETSMTEAVRVAPLAKLVYLSYDHVTSLEPLSFRYSRDSALLIPYDIQMFVRQLKDQCKVAPPVRGIASFDIQDHCIRVRVLDPAEQASSLSINIDYEAEYSRSASTSADPCSRGLLEKVTRKLATRVDLRDTYNATFKWTPHSEMGKMILFGNTLTPATTKNVIRDIEKSLEGLEVQEPESQSAPNTIGRRAAVCSVSVFPDRIESIFLSMRFEREDEHGRIKRILMILEDVVHREGFVLRISDSVIFPVTEAVIGNIEDSDAMLQIVTRRLGEEENKIDLTWLNAEYLTAKQRKMPCVRVVDTFGSHVERHKWWQYLRIARDQSFVEFDTAGEDDHIREKIRFAVQELARELKRRKSETISQNCR